MAINPVTLFTAARQAAIEAQAIVGGSVVNNRLILTRNNGQTIDAGYVKGDPGTMTQAQLDASIQALLATSGTPAADGTAARGTSTFAARADHVHPLTGGDQGPTAVGTATGVTTSGTKCYTRGRNGYVNVNLTNTATLASGASLFVLPTGYRPAEDWFVELVIASLGNGEDHRRVHIRSSDGIAQLQGSISSTNQILRGSFSFPLI